MSTSYEDFINNYRDLLAEYWGKISSEILEWKNQYEWPKGIKLEKAIEIRNSLEISIKKNLNTYNYITKEVFDQVMVWGFGIPTKIPERTINEVTKRAFAELQSNNISGCAKILTEIYGVGISRASKIIALSNQDCLGIYDSRAAHGLFDLVFNDKRLIPIPPGKVIAGDYLPNYGYCEAFQKYIYVLKFLLSKAQKEDGLSNDFKRVADVEIALFSRSRSILKAPKINQIPEHLRRTRKLNNSTIEEGNYYWTLAVGNKAKLFKAEVMENGIFISTGENYKSNIFLTSLEIKNCLLHFKKYNWFPLGNNITNLTPGGLGDYFLNTLHKSPKYAGHFAAIWVNQGLLTHRYGNYNRIELKVL
ncbi:MAG: hypothetical protein GF353_08980 [Candidatus Lokiarchaeota archaeon]|nr:hypothetical protein [Candidatus Lokiarchaeota archaeon]